MDDAALIETLLTASTADLMAMARRSRDAGHGHQVSYSRKVFIPLTRLCRDLCGYCTFSRGEARGRPAYLSPDEVLVIARAGRDAGCHEALFTLGDRPEDRHRAAREGLAALGYASTVDYLEAMCRLVIAETGLLPHVNAGVLTADEMARLRKVSISQGIMLESISPRLCEPGEAHHGSPDKVPAVRMAMMHEAGRQAIPFTSGVLIGIGETRQERLETLIALRDLHAEHGHLQEVIVQNFRAKAGTPMARAPEPDLEDLLWTIACARVVLGPAMNIQAPPNLSGDDFGNLLDAGINDWGGISPVTPDHVNPHEPWPAIARLARVSAAHGKTLAPRFATYPALLADMGRWIDQSLHTPLLHAMDASGRPREDGWRTGQVQPPPRIVPGSEPVDPAVAAVIARVRDDEAPDEDGVTALLDARGATMAMVLEAADALRAETAGDVVRYVVNRNINYTNVCNQGCGFCAFSKGRRSAQLRGPAYNLDLGEVSRRAAEAWDRGATEVCMQGGIHPAYTGQTYLDLLAAAKAGAPGIHVHAFSPLEVRHGAQTLGLSVPDYLARLKEAGLGSLPGTAAEILDDAVRNRLCADKLGTDEWIGVIEAAHNAGLATTATIMFGHIETTRQQARHLLRVRALQARTGGITEFVPLPFIAAEAPIFLRGMARPGPTWREAVLMHAVARIALHPLIPNIQVSWTKLGEAGVLAALAAGANDLGGTLMNESISRAAGSEHGQEWTPATMEGVIRAAGRVPQQRSTLYRNPPARQVEQSYMAADLLPLSIGASQ